MKPKCSICKKKEPQDVSYKSGVCIDCYLDLKELDFCKYVYEKYGEDDTMHSCGHITCSICYKNNFTSIRELKFWRLS